MEKPNFECFNWNEGYREATCKRQCLLCENNSQEDIKEFNEQFLIVNKLEVAVEKFKDDEIINKLRETKSNAHWRRIIKTELL